MAFCAACNATQQKQCNPTQARCGFTHPCLGSASALDRMSKTRFFMRVAFISASQAGDTLNTSGSSLICGWHGRLEGSEKHQAVQARGTLTTF